MAAKETDPDPPAGSDALALSRLSAFNPDLLVFDAPSARVSVLGGVKLSGLDRLRVTLKVEEAGGGGLPVRERLDLYTASQVERLATRLSETFGVERTAARTTLLHLTEALEGYRLQELGALAAPAHTAHEMTEPERRDASAFLSAPGLMERTQEAIAQSGVVGEETNRLLMYVAFTSRKLAAPLHVVSLGPSGSGKTHLQEAVSRLIPHEDRIEVTTLTENALYYFAGEDLRHRLILIEDLDGAEAALYPLRELMSKGRLTKTLALKDARGKLRPVTVRAEGPVVVAGCSTREALYEDNENRAVVLHTDQSAAQDVAVLDYQRRLASGEVDREGQEAVRRLVQNAQRLLRPLRVVNPYAERLSLPERVTRRRRTNRLYLSCVEAVALYHQRQRELRRDAVTGEETVVATLEDVAWANRLLAPVLVGRSDELSGACRQFLLDLSAFLEEKRLGTFRSSEVRRSLMVSPSTLTRHLNALRRFGLLEIAGGTQTLGYDYRLTGADDYARVAEAVEQDLNAVLDELKREEAHDAPAVAR